MNTELTGTTCIPTDDYDQGPGPHAVEQEMGERVCFHLATSYRKFYQTNLIEKIETFQDSDSVYCDCYNGSCSAG